jgi:RNA polymerase sigma factor (sigma-70 family)
MSSELSPELMTTIACAARKAPWNLRDDARQEAAIGVLSAMRRYDPAHGACLRTFADRRARGAVIDFCRGWSPMSRNHRRLVAAGECEPIVLCPIDAIPNHRDRGPSLKSSLQDQGPSPETEYQSTQSSALLHAAIRQLSPAEAYVIKGFYFDGESMAQIARALRCNEPRVQYFRGRAIRQLRHLLDNPLRRAA